MDYWGIQNAKIEELFNTKEIEKSLSSNNFCTKNQTVLKFIVENPNERYFSIINIFDISENKIFDLVIDCESSKEERKKLKEFKSTRLY